MENLLGRLEVNPVIAAVTDIGILDQVLEAESEIVFLLGGTLFNLKESVKKVKAKQKMCCIHFDLVDGIGKNLTALEYVIKEFRPDGIISTKAHIINCAKKLGICTIQRHFIIDSMSLQNTIQMIKEIKPDAVEILPGIIDEVIVRLKEETNVPIIAGGLISDKKHVVKCLGAGAVGISTTNQTVWTM